LIWHAVFVSLASVEIDQFPRSVFTAAIISGTLAVAFVPLMASLPRFVRWAAGVTGVLIFLPLGLLIVFHASWEIPWALFALPVGVTAYALSLTLVRRAIHAAVQPTGTAPLLRLGIGLCAYSGSLFLLARHFESPVYLLQSWGVRPHLLTVMWFTLVLLRFLCLVALWPFLFCAACVLVLLLHRFFWTHSARAVHALWDAGLLKNRKALAGLGVFFLSAGGWPQLASLFSKVRTLLSGG
jgi:hypothetical protein